MQQAANKDIMGDLSLSAQQLQRGVVSLDKAWAVAWIAELLAMGPGLELGDDAKMRRQ